MTQPVYKLKDDHAASIRHVRELYTKVVSEFATIQNTYPQTVIDEQLTLMLKKDGTRQATNTLQYSAEPVLANRTDIPHLGYAIDSLALKADKLTTYTKTESDTALGLKANQATTYTKSETDTLLTSKKNTGTFDAKIQNSTTNSAIDCSGANQIDLKVNGANRGYFFQPTGQPTTPLGLLSTDKLQLQSQLSSTSVFGSKPLNDPLNTHGLYVGGIDDPAKNVQSTVNVTQGNAQVYLTAGHVNPGSGMTDFSALAANGILQVSGGLQPGIQDKQILLYANSKGQALPIQTDGKMGYSSTTAITEANQFTSKTYVDTQNATKLSLSGGTMTGDIVLKGAPTQPLNPATKAYVDSAFSGVPSPDLNPYLQKAGGTMTGSLVLAAAPTSDLQASTKKYVDDKYAQVTTLVDKNQADGAVYKLDIDSNRVNFYRGDGTDKYLEVFGSASQTQGTTTISSNRDIMRFPTLGTTLERSEWQFGCGTEVANGAPYTNNALFRIVNGNVNSQAYTEIFSQKLKGDGTSDGTSSSIIMFPKQTGTLRLGNFIQFRDGAGYSTDADYSQQDGLSILSRDQNDDRYELKGQGGAGSAGDLLSEAAADPINIYLSNGIIRLRKNVQDFMAFGEMSAFGNPFLRTVDRYEWEQQALISSSFTPAKQLRLFSIIDQTTAPSSDYPQFIIEHNRGGDLRLSAFNYNTAKTQLYMHPGALTKTNHIEADRLLGYREDYTIGTSNDYSILPRALNDSRYALKNEIPTIDSTKIFDANITAIVSSTVSSQPELILRTGAEDFIKFKRASSNTAQIITHPFLAIQSNNIAPNYEVQIKSGLQALKFGVNGTLQTASITNGNSAIQFDDAQTNAISFTGRPGLIPSSANVVTDNNSFLTKAESVALFGSGSGGGGGAQSQIVATDTSTVSISNGGFCTISNSAGKQIVIRSDLGFIFPNGTGANLLGFYSKGTSLDVDGGALFLYGTTQASGLCNIFTRATGYDRDNVSMVSSRQFTSKQYVDSLASNYLPSNTTLAQLAAPTSSLSLNSQKITNLSDPSDGQDAATKTWVLSQVSSGGNQLTYGTQVLLGNVPFTSGSQNVVYALTFNATNFPVNPSSIITGIDWVRQSGRTDTIRLRVKLSPSIVNGRNFTVYCQPQTKFANTSGGPTSDWQFGDSLNRYVLQTFNIDVANNRFYVHVCDTSDTANENLLLNMLIAF